MKPLAASDPQTVGEYRILAELGRGGMGRVLLGSAPDGRLVAVKQVRAQYVEDDGFRARFRREVDASQKVSGAYTAAVIDADVNAPLPWLASMFVPGTVLSQAIEAVGPFPEESVLRLAAGLASALIEIHRAGLIHRDLKPSNVLLTADGLRVIDFGIARAMDTTGGSELTHTNWLVGSPGFMSPEQADDRPVTPASDMFSLGTVLVTACTGANPFAGSSTPQTLYRVVHSAPDLSAVPEGLRRVIEPCLAKDPDQRPTPAQLLELIGPLAPAEQPWPPATHKLIDRQQAEIAQLLSGPPSAEPSSILRQSPPLGPAVDPDVLTAPVNEHPVGRVKPWVVATIAGVAIAQIAIGGIGAAVVLGGLDNTPGAEGQATGTQPSGNAGAVKAGCTEALEAERAFAGHELKINADTAAALKEYADSLHAAAGKAEQGSSLYWSITKAAAGINIAATNTRILISAGVDENDRDAIGRKMDVVQAVKGELHAVCSR